MGHLKIEGSPTTYQCTLSGGEGEKVEFYYDKTLKKVTASIISSDSRIPIHYLPPLFRTIPNEKAFLQLMPQGYAKVSQLSNGRFSLYFGIRGLGGMFEEQKPPPYSPSPFENLKQLIINLANPLLTEELLAKLNEIAQKADLNRSITSYFANMILPEEITQCISDIDKKYKDDFQQIKKHIVGLVNSCKRILENRKEEPIWPELRTLFQLPFIRRLDNRQLQEINSLIREGKKERLRKMLRDILSSLNEREEDVDAQLEQLHHNGGTTCPNLATLTAQVINQKPKTRDGITAFMERPPAYFLNKTLHYKDPMTSQTTIYEITKCKKDTQGYLVFSLEPREDHYFKLAFSPMDKQLIKKKREKKSLGKALQDKDFIPQGTEFTIELARKDDIPWIVPGKYRLTNWNKSVLNKQIEIVIKNIKTDALYKITMFYKNQEIGDVLISRYTPQTRKYDQLERENYRTFNKQYLAIKKEKDEIIPGINSSNIDEIVRINEEISEEKIRQQFLEQIETKTEEVRILLFEEANQELLETLLDGWVEQNFDPQELLRIARSKSSSLISHLDEISHLYKEKLQQLIPPEELLQMIVEKVNYERMIQRENSTLILKTMQLFTEIHRHTESLSNQEVIIIMGNTGSGKSTAASYLLGAKLETFHNRVGMRVVRLDPKKQQDKANYPEIGQSLGQSETLYTRGYNIPETHVKLVDSPGFDDTRGGGYEFCGHLSVDQAMDKIKKVRALVVTVPAQDFSLNKGNPVIELVFSIRERFPHAFKNTPAGKAMHLYLIITRTIQLHDEEIPALKRGDYILQLIQETERIRKTTSDHFALSQLDERLEVWNAIKRMYDQDRVDIIDVENALERRDLLKKYLAPGNEVEKTQYLPNFQNPATRRKLGQYIELATHTWETLLNNYSQHLPEELGNILSEIKMKKSQLLRLEHERNNLPKKIQEETLRSDKLKEFIQELQQAKKNSSQTLEEFYLAHPSLKDKVTQIKNTEIQQLESAIAATESQISETKKQLEVISARINTVNHMIEKNTNEVSSLEAKLTTLSSGATEDLLYEACYQPNAKLLLAHYKDPNLRKQLFNEVRYATSDEFDLEETNTSNYTGTLQHIAVIDRNYCLVPTDPTYREQFLKMGRGGEFIAKVDGYNYEVDLGRNATADGKKIAYGFLTRWIKGDQKLPWIKITHTVPNTEYNAASIANTQASIKSLKEQLDQFNQELNEPISLSSQGGKKAQKKQLEETLSKLECTLTEQQKSKTTTIKRQKIQGLDELIQETNNNILIIQNKIKQLKDTTEIDTAISTLKNEIAIMNKKLQKTRKKKRNLAIIIKREKSTVENLMQSVDLLLKNATKHNYADPHLYRDSVLDACRKFKEAYEKNKSMVYLQCENDLHPQIYPQLDDLEASTETAI